MAEPSVWRGMTDEVALKYLADIRESEAALAALAARVEEAERERNEAVDGQRVIAAQRDEQLRVGQRAYDRADAAEARVEELERAIEHVVCDSPGTPETVKGYLRAALRGGSPTPPPQRFTDRGAECKLTHVEGYTGRICSCAPWACRLTTPSPSEETKQ